MSVPARRSPLSACPGRKSTLLGLIAGLDTPSTVACGSTAMISSRSTRMAGRSRAPARWLCVPVVPAAPRDDGAGERDAAARAGEPDAQRAAEAMLERVGLASCSAPLSEAALRRRAAARGDCARLRHRGCGGRANRQPRWSTGAQIIDLMFRLNAERGTTLLLVTHDEHLSQRCGRVLRRTEGW